MRSIVVKKGDPWELHDGQKTKHPLIIVGRHFLPRLVTDIGFQSLRSNSSIICPRRRISGTLPRDSLFNPITEVVDHADSSSIGFP